MFNWLYKKYQYTIIFWLNIDNNVTKAKGMQRSYYMVLCTRSYVLLPTYLMLLVRCDTVRERHLTSCTLAIQKIIKVFSKLRSVTKKHRRKSYIKYVKHFFGGGVGGNWRFYFVCSAEWVRQQLTLTYTQCARYKTVQSWAVNTNTFMALKQSSSVYVTTNYTKLPLITIPSWYRVLRTYEYCHYHK